MKEQDQHTPEEDPDEHYLGNIWGWKFSYIGLGLILFFLAFAVIRAKILGVPLTPNPENSQIELSE